MGDVAGPSDDERQGWAPLEPADGAGAPDGDHPTPTPPPPTPTPAPPPSATPGGPGNWGPPTTPPGWGPSTPPPPWQPPPGNPYANAAYGAAGGYGGYQQPKAGDTRTGPLPLHPMSVGDVLDGAFKLLKANARTVLLVVASVVVPLQLLSAFALREQVSPGLLNVLRDPTLAESQSTFSLGDAATSGVTVLLGLITAPLIAGAVSRVCAASYLGHPIGPADALKATLKRLPALLAVSFLVFVVQAIGFVLCILPGIAVTVLYSAVTPALMIEEIGPIAAMRRSWRLLKPRFWPVLGIVALAWLIASFIGNLLGGIPSAVGTIFGGTFAWLWVGVGAVLASIVSAPITAIVDTLLYFDGRIRHEGFDLQVMANDLERSGPR
jgi:hypothetical protein